MNNTMEKVYEIYIKATPEQVWEEIADPGLAGRMFMLGEGSGPPTAAETAEVESDPPRKLVRTMLAKWSPEVEAEGTTRITFEIEAVGTSSMLRVIHDQMREGANGEIYGGWPMILSALKTHLETGETLDTPASIRFAEAV